MRFLPLAEVAGSVRGSPPGGQAQQGFDLLQSGVSLASPGRVQSLLNAAWASMQAGRAQRSKRIRRTLRRSWTYGGGKKTAAKVGIGVAFGAVFVGVSIATAGAGAPVVAGLAVGAWAVGQATDAGFAKLSGRRYRGLKRTANWVNDYRTTNSQEQQDNAMILNERAHKTIRRSFEHLRRAVRKWEAARPAVTDFRNSATCHDAMAVALSTFSVSHHLDKARNYAYPSMFMCRLLLNAVAEWRTAWLQAEPKLEQAAGDVIDRHGQCGSPCYASDTIPQVVAARRPGAPTLWTDAEIQDRRDRLDEMEKLLDSSGVVPPPPPAPGARDAQVRGSLMFKDAAARYHIQHKTLKVKVKHGIQSMWARKTKGERKAFVVGQVLKGGVAAAGGAIGGTADLDAWTEPLIEAGFQAFDYAAGQATDGATADRPDQQLMDEDSIKHHEQASLAAAETQNHIQKAAVHVQEMIRLKEAIESGGDAQSCEEAVQQAREIFKVLHHIGKTQMYLDPAINLTELLCQSIADGMDHFRRAQNQAWAAAAAVAGKTKHADCAAVCYGPRDGLPAQPARPLR